MISPLTIGVCTSLICFFVSPSNSLLDLAFLGFEFNFPDNVTPPIEEIKSALQDANIPIKSIYTDTNVAAYIAFETAHQAARSQNGFLSGSIKISPDASTSFPTAYHGGGVISSSVSIFPSYALEVMGIPQDQSAQYVLDQLQDVEVFKAERSATVKFKKHEHVRPLFSRLN